MTDDIEELLRQYQSQQSAGAENQVLDQLLNMILNPTNCSRQRIILEDNAQSNVLYEIREANIINQEGMIEEQQELVINTNVFVDGRAQNLFGIVKCPHCGEIIGEESLRICGVCNRLICVSASCSKYVSRRNQFYCNSFHRFLGFIGL